MKKMLLATTAAALLLVTPVAGNALTLSIQGGLNASGGASVGGTGVSVGTLLNGSANANGSSDVSGSVNGGATAAANGSTNIDESAVLGAIAGNQSEFDALANLQADSKVEVVRVGGIVSDTANADVFNQALTANADATAKLQAAIKANADLNAQLGQSNIDVSTIVAADVAADGTLVLYSNS